MKITYRYMVFILFFFIQTIFLSCVPLYTRGTHYYFEKSQDVERNLARVKILRPHSFKNPSRSLWCVLDDNYSDDPKTIIVLRVKSNSRPNSIRTYSQPNNIIAFYPDPHLNKTELIYKTTSIPGVNTEIRGHITVLKNSRIYNDTSYDGLMKMLGGKNEKIVTIREYLFGTNDSMIKMKNGEYVTINVSGSTTHILIKKVDMIGEIGTKDYITWYRKAGQSRVSMFEFYGTGVAYYESEIVAFLPNHLYEYIWDTAALRSGFKEVKVSSY